MKFNFKPVPNRKLDTIAGMELDKGKVKYESSNLAKLADDDWDLFVFYNIEDVNVIKLLEVKLCFLRVARTLSYMGMVPLNKALDTLPIVNGYCAVNAYEEGKVIPTFKKDSSDWRSFEGAYVKQPVPGFYQNVVSFDLNSLYPMTMITLNTSPETKFGKVQFRGDKVSIEDNTGRISLLTKENFEKILKKGNLALSKSNILFTQSKRGIFPTMAEEVYNKRLEYKGLIKKNKNILSETQCDEEKKKASKENVVYDVMQMSFKILINSLYGYCGNRYAFMSDVDIAESVTSTCREVIKSSGDILNKIANTVMQQPDSDEDMVIYSDTDSCYFGLTRMIEHLNLPFYEGDDTTMVSEKVVKLCGIVENKLNEKIMQWGVDELNSQDCRFQFKMEAISDKALFIAKKMYVLHVLNDEGFHVSKESKRWKYKGVKLVSAGMPEDIKPLVEKVVHVMVMTNKKSLSDDLYIEAYEKFKELEIDSVCLVKSINKFDEYVKNCDGWNTAPRMNASYRGAFYYNKIIDDLGVTDKYAKITRSDKVKYVYIHSTNKYGIDVISYIDNYPEEFNDLFEINTNLMFEKGVKDVVKQFYAAAGWPIVSPNKQAKIDVMEEFFI
jgi:DNA polymerase elongation subunit (family B)